MANKPSINITSQRYKTPVSDKAMTPFKQPQPKRIKTTYLGDSMYEPESNLKLKPKSSRGHL